MKKLICQVVLPLLFAFVITSCERKWVVIKLENEASVNFPTQPTYSETTDSSEYGSYIKKDYGLLPSDNEDENLVYQLSVYSMPLAYNLSFQQTYENFIRQEVELLGGRLISQRVISINDTQACEALIDFRNDEYRVKCRIFVRGRKVYNIGVATKKDMLFNLNINKFLNGLKFVK